jgi:alpha-1,6-mannosyltransferase
MLPQTTGRRRDCVLVTIWLTAFVACFWLVEEFVPQWEFIGPNMLSRKIYGFVGLSVSLGFPYWQLLKRKRLNVPVGYAAVLVFLAASLSPTALQTDQIRYVWDGILTMRGENPYTLAPADHLFFSAFPGNQQLNHANLPTIYPPLAQWIFGLSTVFNPMLWYGYLGWEWAPVQMPALGFTLEIGWKIMAGLVAAASLFLLRARRWDLFFLHPLILITWLGNSHVDLLMCACLILLFEGGRRLMPIRESIVLSAGILTKGSPLLFVPFFAVRWFRKFPRPAVFGASLALCCTLVAAPILYYQITSNGNFFHSPKVFAQNWVFFGYMSGFFGDIGKLLGSNDPINLARIACLSIWIPLYLFLIALALHARVSTRLLCFMVYTSFLWFSPTLHPWYLIGMLYLGLPYIQIFPVIWIWPVLALTSHIYYIDRLDPVLLRLGVYGIVTFLNGKLVHTLWQNRKQFRRAELE